jgi:cell division protein FtsI (penicillin-binding protein 3)
MLIIIKSYVIFSDKKVFSYSVNQYNKKSKQYGLRGSIFDKNNALLQYSYFDHAKKNNLLYKRYYASKSVLAFTGIVNHEQQGISGLEQYYDSYLYKKKIMHYEPKLYLGDVFCKQNAFEYPPDLHTTVDTDFSELCFDILEKHVNERGSEFATVVCMDADSGAVEVMVQYPQYAPCEDAIKIDFLYPRAINDAYEMGSIMKIFLMVSALQEEIVSKDSLINCYGVKEKKIQGIPLTTWQAHGVIPFWQVIQESNNFGVGQIGLIMGDKLYDYYTSFGFSQKLDIPFCAASKGYLAPPSQWSKRTPLSLSFGYEMRCSLMQLVQAITLFIHEGKMIKPRFLSNAEIAYIPTLSGKKAANEGKSIIKMDKKKLAASGCHLPEGCVLFGKTGTSNLLVDGQYDKTKNAYVFVGFFEYQNVKKVVAIYTYLSDASNVYSSQISLPVISKIINAYIKNIDNKYFVR